MGGGGVGNEAMAATNKAAKKVGCSMRVDPCRATSPLPPSLFPCCPRPVPLARCCYTLPSSSLSPLCSPPVTTPRLPPPFTPSPLSFPFPAFRGCCPLRIGCPQRMGTPPCAAPLYCHPCTAPPMLYALSSADHAGLHLPSPPVRHVAGGQPPERTKSFGLFKSRWIV